MWLILVVAEQGDGRRSVQLGRFRWLKLNGLSRQGARDKCLRFVQAMSVLLLA